MPGTFVGVYWSARADELADCTTKALEHFRLLADTDEGLKRWFRLASRKPKTPSEVNVTSAETVTPLWSVNRRDIDRSVMTDLGWTLGLWNGEMNGLSAGTSLHCGSTFSPVSNSALLNISGESIRAIDDDKAVELLKKLVELWDADKGVAYHFASVNEEIEIASYQRRRWPIPWQRNAVRHAKGYIRIAG